MKTKILFICHEASLSGAPLVLLYFMEWLKEHHSDEFEIGILHLKSGDIEDRFNAVVDSMYKIENKKKLAKVADKLSNGIFSKIAKTPIQKCIQEILKDDYALIYANTVAALPIAIQIKRESKKNIKVLAHIHEMQASLKNYVKQPKGIIEYIDQIIAVSHAVKSSIIEQWDFSKSNIEVVYEFSKIYVNEKIKNKNKETKFTIGGSGLVSNRKGYDLFIQTARYIKQNYPAKNMQFQWVGKINDKNKNIIDEDLKKLELQNSVKFIGQQFNPHQYFNNFDIFLMTSREDPFPLVCIEVAMLSKPIICFEKATGTEEILKNGGGKIVPYLDIEKMSEAVMSYYNDYDSLNKDALKVKEVFKGFTPEEQCPNIYSIINKI